MPTDRQIARLYALANRAGLSHDQVIAELFDRYEAMSSKSLQGFQYEQYCTDLQRRGKSPEGSYREGAYASADHVREYVESAVQFGRLWRGEMTDQDARALIVVMDDFRRHRTRDRRLSQKQMDAICDKLRAFPLEIFRRAAGEWLAKYRSRGEKYFVGIMKGMMRDDAHQAALSQGTLQLV
jgi:hypothetical protein